MPGETVLILGGTAEARALAGRLTQADGRRVITSLAGRTSTPAAIPGEVRIGGFGGALGLRAYLKAEAVDLVVDTTHPFAATMAANAAAACAVTGVPCLRLERPAWVPGLGDDWRVVPHVKAAAAAIPTSASALVTVGRQEIGSFLERNDIRMVARMIESPDMTLPDHATLILARPPFALDEELALFAEHGIDVLVAKNAGGSASAAKLEAARERGIPVIMVARPDKPPVPTVTDVDAMTARIAAHFS